MGLDLGSAFNNIIAFAGAPGLALQNNVGHSIGYLGDEWISNNVHVDMNYPGSLVDLTQLILQQTDQCGNWVHQQNFLHNTANARSYCQGKINTAYAPLLQKLQGDAKQYETTLQNSLLSGNKQLYAIIALVVLVLLVITIILF